MQTPEFFLLIQAYHHFKEFGEASTRKNYPDQIQFVLEHQNLNAIEFQNLAKNQL